MQRVIQYIFIICAFALSFSSCSKSSDEDEEPQTKLSTIAGTWLEYAYLNSDGYFTDISNTGYNMYYEFAIPNKFTQYSINENGEKEIFRFAATAGLMSAKGKESTKFVHKFISACQESHIELSRV